MPKITLYKLSHYSLDTIHFYVGGALFGRFNCKNNLMFDVSASPPRIRLPVLGAYILFFQTVLR